MQLTAAQASRLHTAAARSTQCQGTTWPRIWLTATCACSLSLKGLLTTCCEEARAQLVGLTERQHCTSATCGQPVPMATVHHLELPSDTKGFVFLTLRLLTVQMKVTSSSMTVAAGRAS